jgi:hypothetical protein
MIGANELCANLSCKRRTQLEAQGKYWRWTFFWFEITDNTLCKYFFKEYIYIKKKQIQSINKYSKAARNDRYLQISPKKNPNNIQIKSVYVNITCKKKHTTIAVGHHHTQEEEVVCVLFCFSSSCVWWCPTAIVVCVLFCFSSSCVWWCPTAIVVCALFCLSLSYVWWCPTAIVVCFVLLRRRETKHTPQ